MSTDLYRGSDTEAFLSVLSKRMAAKGAKGVPNRLGAEEDARNASPPGIVWVPMGEDYGEPDVQLPDRTVVARAAERFQVSVWGTSYAHTKELRRVLMASLNTCGPEENDYNATSLSAKALRGDWELEQQNTRGALLVMQVILYWPVTDEEIHTAHVATTNADGQVIPPDGSAPQPI